MKTRTGFLIILFLLLFAFDAFAQTAIKAEVDKTNITTDDYVTYKIIVTSSEKNIPSPQLPKFEGLVVLSRAQSSSISFDKQGTKTILIFAYILAPKNIGKFKIEPTQVKIKGQIYSTQAFEIEVTPGKTLPEKQRKEKSTAPRQDKIESGQPQITL